MDPYLPTVPEIVTSKIFEAMAQGNIHWHMPWSSIGTPRNAVSKRPYPGIKTLLLGMVPYADSRWLTYRQAPELGGYVKKGEKATMVVFWKEQEIRSDHDEARTIPLLRYYNVFNIEQCGRLKRRPVLSRNIEPIATAEAIVAEMANRPSITDDGDNRACYMPATDSIHLPPKAAFDSSCE
jgi:antirestriction protein ArdC